jgi:P4 family phage/plasmid primase-like protien
LTMIYAGEAHRLKKSGYSPLPLPPGKKFPPPDGWTGNLAPMASGADIQAWVETVPEDSNIAIRLPDGVVGIDIDQYDDKVGADTIRNAIDMFGKLPIFGRLTARPETPSGIRLFRVPAGAKLYGNLDSAGIGPDVDIIQNGHRYLVGPGSIHPEGGEYRWHSAQSAYSILTLPDVEELPWLPTSWLEGLTKKVAEARNVESEAYAVLDDRVKARVDAYAENAIAATYDELDEMKTWEEDYRGRHGGWEESVLALTASLASLVKADWCNVDAEKVAADLVDHLPNDAKFTIGNGLSKFVRALEGGNVTPRTPPFDLKEDDAWFEDEPYTPTRPFGEAGDAPGAEPAITVWPQYEQNDFGNSQRIAAWAKGNLFWLHDAKVWVRYNGVHWEKSEGAGDNAAVQALNVAYQLEMDHYPDTAAEGETSPQKKFFNWVVSQKMAGKYSAAARTAQMSEALNRSEHDFDADPYLLGVQNGTVDLRTGELRPGTKDELIATVTPSRYDPTATAPRFMKYLEESLPDPEVRAYLQRAMGYSITGTTIEQIMFIHHGKTSNGKSVLMNVLAAVVGQYSGGADPKALIESKNEQHSTHVASLAGPRLLMMSETARGARLSDTLIKQITGGDWVTARKLYKENQDYRILGKIHMATNHLPHIVSSPSTNRRIHLVHWPVEVAEEKIDLRLASKIIGSELEGVLNWLVQGAIEWYRTLEESQSGPIRKGGRPSGLAAPAQILIDTAKYLRSEDNIQEWMDERTEPSDDVISAKDLYWDYRSWAEARGDRPMTQRAMCMDLESHDIEKKRTAAYNGYRIALKPLQAVRNFFDEA